MLPEDRFFWVKGEDDQEYGPVGLEELRDWVQENRAGLGTEVRLDEPGSRWEPWQSHPELIALLAEAQLSSPVPGVPGLELAPLWKRLGAFVFDGVLIFFLAMPIFTAMAYAYAPDFIVQAQLAELRPESFPLPEPTNQQEITVRLCGALLIISYMTGFVAAHAKTPSKAIWGLRVVDARGQKPTLGCALVRSVAMVFSMWLYFIPFTYVYLNPQRRAFHDYVAGTYVVKA